MMKLFVMAVMGLGLLGCATGSATGMHKTASSGEIGCAEDDIVIGDVSNKIGGQSWTATCKGHRFFCVSKPRKSVFNLEASCKEAVQELREASTKPE